MRSGCVVLWCAFAACGDGGDRYPAVSDRLPQVMKGTGDVMASVRMVPVFYPNDPVRAQLMTALTGFSHSPVWNTQVAEYGVGALSIGPAVDLAGPAPASFTDVELDALLLDRLDGTHPEWGPTDAATRATTIYILFLPQATAITGPLGRACVDYGAYHDATAPSSGVIYAVMPECAGASADSLFAHTTHEIVEAATDPFGDAFNFIADDDFAWGLAFGGTEVGDLCQLSSTDVFVEPGVGSIQREWSNAAAAAFDRPCVPGVDPPLVVAVPDARDTLTARFEGTSHALRGVKLTLGVPRTIDVHLASAAPTPPASVSVSYLGDGTTPVLFALDRETGVDGDVVHLELTPIRATTEVTSLGVTAEIDGALQLWPLAIDVAP